MLPDNYYSLSRPEMVSFVPVTSKKILEIGCGEGGFVKNLRKKIEGEYWGIDINPEIQNNASAVFDKLLIGDIVTQINLMPKNYFDCVLLNDVIEHLPDPQLVLRLLKSKCTPKANFVCSIPNVRYYKVLYELLIKKDWNYVDSGILDRTHLRFFTKKSIVEMFRQIGFKVVKIEGINPIVSRKFRIFNLCMFGIFSDTKFLQYACVAQPI